MGSCLGKSAPVAEDGVVPATDAVAASTEAGKAAAEVEVAKNPVARAEDAMEFNEALVFIKPHAANAKVRDLVAAYLAEHHVEVLSEGELSGAEIDAGGIIDSHYSHIAKIAMSTKASELEVAEDKKAAFAERFGRGTWDELAANGDIVNLAEYRQSSGRSFDDIEVEWRKSDTFKLAPGTYVGFLVDAQTFIMNAFYGVMREVYTAPDAKVVFLTVRFPEAKLSWKDFRGKVIGATDPTKAPAGSLRGKILADYEALGLSEAPNMGQNGVHASAGPIEGLRERMVWVGEKVETNPFGKALLAAGVKRALLDSWLNNERVTINGETDNAFDLLEDINSTDALRLALEASRL